MRQDVAEHFLVKISAFQKVITKDSLSAVQEKYRGSLAEILQEPPTTSVINFLSYNHKLEVCSLPFMTSETPMCYIP